ncbi:MAG: ribosome maturation factor RimM [Stackebrandtia sp.]
MKLVVGRIVRPHGVRGDVACEVRTDEPEQRFVPGAVLAADPGEAGPLTVEDVRWNHGRLLLHLAGVNDREGAEELRGVLVCVDSEDLSDPDDPDEFRDHDLVGLSVVLESGETVGAVARVEHAPAHDLLVIDRPGAKPALIPFIREMVPAVDLDAARVVVSPPEGLLEL